MALYHVTDPLLSFLVLNLNSCLKYCVEEGLKGGAAIAVAVEVSDRLLVLDTRCLGVKRVSNDP